MASTIHSILLIAADEDDGAQRHEAWLSESFEVHRASSSKEGLEILDRDMDVILLDGLYGGFADEFLTDIGREVLGCRTALLTEAEPDIDSTDLVIDEYLIKPIGENELLDVIERLSKRAAYEKQVSLLYSLASQKAALEFSRNRDEEKLEKLGQKVELAVEEADATLLEVLEYYDIAELVDDPAVEENRSSKVFSPCIVTE